ncbi:MotA/TolQ/ExbB proton channel family protein, partial [Undibacterium sp. Tian12W]
MKTRFSAFLAATLLALTAAVAVAPVSAQESASAAASAAAPAPAPAADAAPAPAAPADAGAPAAPAAAKEMVDNPYGLDALWKTGDFVAKGTLIIMVIMSMGSWYILITKIIDQVKLSGQATDARSKFWKAASVQAGAASLKEGSPFRFIADSGIKATEH